MTRTVLASLVSLLLLGAPFARAEQSEMETAREALEQARAHLQASPHEYSGHRSKALERVNQALEQIRLGLATSAGPERKLEKQEGRLQKKEQTIDERMQAIQKKRQQMAP